MRLPAFVLEQFFAVYQMYWRSAEHSCHCIYISSLPHTGRKGRHLQMSWFSPAGPLVYMTSEQEPQHVARTSYSVKIQRKCFKVYFANSPSELWLLASAIFPLPTPSQLAWDFPLLITDALKSRILTKGYWACLLPCAFSVQCLLHTAKPYDPIHTCRLQLQRVLRLSTQPF